MSNSIRDLLARAGIDPKKSLGQNFLIDDSYLDRIADAAALTPADAVLEIGPGLGALTARLAARAGCVTAVELDDRLIAYLRGEFLLREQVHIVHGDILENDPAALMEACGAPGYKVVANLPYYITSAVLRRLLEADAPPVLAVVMVQEEVARRICAEPGDMSILSVAVQFYAAPSLAFTVPAGAFYPRPKVDSAVLRLDVQRRPETAGVDDEAEFFRVVRAGFSQKRKQLRNSLSAGLRMDKDATDAALRAAGIDPARRAQSLSLADWAALYHVLQS
ncbi:MAG: ribosomal RNA small subunit methyltransferase A [Caldilineaceae bacterium]|nr:ribosomal RNA small subunit methyltransferase A [Caldilineaceae bacterium]